MSDSSSWRGLVLIDNRGGLPTVDPLPCGRVHHHRSPRDHQHPCPAPVEIRRWRCFWFCLMHHRLPCILHACDGLYAASRHAPVIIQVITSHSARQKSHSAGVCVCPAHHASSSRAYVRMDQCMYVCTVEADMTRSNVVLHACRDPGLVPTALCLGLLSRPFSGRRLPQADRIAVVRFEAIIIQEKSNPQALRSCSDQGEFGRGGGTRGPKSLIIAFLSACANSGRVIGNLLACDGKCPGRLRRRKAPSRERWQKKHRDGWQWMVMNGDERSHHCMPW